MVSFNYWIDGDFQVITLNEGETKEFHTGGPNEEGYSHTHYRFTHEGEVIRLEVNNQARDCDGRIESYREFTCTLDKLDTIPSVTGTKTADWQKVDQYQRDYSAEAMGY